jgi:hypothetical protein
MGGILEQREDTVRWVGCQPNQSAIVSYRDSENSALEQQRHAHFDIKHHPSPVRAQRHVLRTSFFLLR